jgi:translation initiation factor IF-3
MQKQNNFRKPPVKQRRHKINSEVRFPQVRLIGDTETKIMSSYEASKLAEAEELDLILINENANPPVVRIDDYNKFLYQLEKTEKERKKNSVKVETKEMQLSAEIGENDLKTKARKCLEFLEHGDKIRCVLQLKGRQKAMPERGEIVMLKMLEMLSELGEPEFLPKLENGKWVTIVKPRKKKNA